MVPTAVGMGDKLADKVANKMTVEISALILKRLGKNPEMTLKQLAATLRKSRRTVERITYKLV